MVVFVFSDYVSESRGYRDERSVADALFVLDQFIRLNFYLVGYLCYIFPSPSIYFLFSFFSFKSDHEQQKDILLRKIAIENPRVREL